MSKTDLTIAMIKTRLMAYDVRLGIPEDVAARKADACISEWGLKGFFGGFKVMGTPEGAIVAIVDTYVKYLKSNNTPATDIFKLSCCAIEAIERHRSRSWPGSSQFPRGLFEYVYYRTDVEVRAQFKVKPGDMGLHKDVVEGMTRGALLVIMKENGLDPNRVKLDQLNDKIALDQKSRAERDLDLEKADGRHIPFSPTLPDVGFCKAVKIVPDLNGRYVALLYKDVATVMDGYRARNNAQDTIPKSMLSYPFVLAMFDMEAQEPIHFFTLEKNSMSNTTAFCEFRLDGSHGVIDIAGSKLLDEWLFLQAALFAAVERFSVEFDAAEAA